VSVFPKMPVDQAVAGFPDSRDLALDVVRSWALLVVVLGHFMMLIVWWGPGHVPVSSNTLASGDPWPWVTWLMQVMPLFFIAGGAVNLGSWQRHEGGYGQWMWQRVSRLMRPTIVYLTVVGVLAGVTAFLVPRTITDPLLAGLTGPLWFLAVYISVVALTPFTAFLWCRYRLASLVGMLVLIVLVDYGRFQVAEPIGLLNLILVWAFVYQLGYWYSQGVSRQAGVLALLTGLTANLIMVVGLDWFPISLVGLPGDEFSNLAPPDVVVVGHGLVLFGLFVLLAPWVNRVFRRPGPLRATIRAGLVAMSVYLWHFLVLMIVVAGLHLLGWDLPVRLEDGLVVPDGGAYWLLLVLVGVVFVALLAVVVAFLWPIEHVKLPGFDVRAKHERVAFARTSTITGVVLLMAGLLLMVGTGVSGFPFAVHDVYSLPVMAFVPFVFAFLGTLLVRRGDRVRFR
jgi:hypothetical protein